MGVHTSVTVSFNAAGHQGSIYPFLHCVATGFGPFNLLTRGTLWNRRDHSPAQGVRRMYLVFSGLSLVCTAYMSIMFGVGANAHLFLSLSLSL